MNVKQYLLSKSWRLKNVNGEVLQNCLVFRRDGRIDGSSHDNESYWQYLDGLLVILNADYKQTCVFSKFQMLSENLIIAYGNFSWESRRVDIRSRSVSAILELNQDYGTYCGLSELALDSKLSGRSDGLLIQVNSVANPFDGNNHKREFNYLANLSALDIVRISQSKPLYWYANKFNELVSILSGYISLYKKVFLLGSSAGGYASLVLSEKLSSIHRDVFFKTYTINPQTTLDCSHIDNIIKSFDRYYIHQDIFDVTLPIEADVDLHLPTYMVEEKLNIQHNIFYDCLNPVESYYVNLVSGFNRVNCWEYSYNLSHGDGCVKIGDSEEFLEYFLQDIKEF